jgi:hypothetical protein
MISVAHLPGALAPVLKEVIAMPIPHEANELATRGPGSRWTNPPNLQVPFRICKNTARLVQVLSVALILSVYACSSDRTLTTPPANVARATLVASLTPTMASLVKADGRLQLAAPVSTGREQISGPRATELALALAKFTMPYAYTFWDAQHGSPIDYQRLAACDEPLFASSSFERLREDNGSLPAHPIQKALGPFWLVRLCGPNGDPQARVAVSAYATDLGITKRGSVDFPAIGGGDFVPAGIPSNDPDAEIPSPEAAIVLAANLTGKHVTAVPELIIPFFKDDNPWGARWHLRLDGPARVRARGGRAVESSDIYIGAMRQTPAAASSIWVSAETQPATVSATMTALSFVGENIQAYIQRERSQTKVIRAVRRPDSPITFSAGAVAP